MMVARAAQLASGDADEAADGQAGDDVGAFLATVATTLRETVTRLESTVGRITETVVTRSAQVDRELVVTLQDFDRLQQEFAALGDLIAHCAATSGARSGTAWIDHHGRKAIAAISVADLKDRFLRHLDGPAGLAASQTSDEVVF
jgi:hypothetical protein